MRRIVSIFCVAVLFLASYEVSAEDRPLKKVTFLPQWAPQAQFAGYYAALDKGIYQKYGLDVTILDGGPEQFAWDYLADHKADFVIMQLFAAIQEWDQGAAIVNIAQIIQETGVMFVAKKTSGIREPADMLNRKVGLWDGHAQPIAFLKKYNLKVEIIPQTYSVNLFLRDGVDVASAMSYNEYHTIINSGYDPDELTTFLFSEHGLNFPEDGIYTLEETFRKDPALCADFVAASLEGWEYAFEHPEEAVDIVLKYMEKGHLPANRMHQMWMLKKVEELILVDGPGRLTGGLKPDALREVAEEMKKNGMIEKIPDYGTFYKKPDIHAAK